MCQRARNVTSHPQGWLKTRHKPANKSLLIALSGCGCLFQRWWHNQHKLHIAGFSDRDLVHSRTKGDKQTSFLVGWSLEHHDAHILTLVQGGSVRYNGSWKYRLAHNSVTNEVELKCARGNTTTTKSKVRGCLALANMESMLTWTETHSWVQIDSSFHEGVGEVVDRALRR